MAGTPYIVLRGVVLRETETKEADKILTLLTAERGKISVIARGVRRKSCRYAACAQPLVWSEWTLYQKGDWYYANEGSTVELFNGLRNDLDAMALGFYFAELTEAVTSEETPGMYVLQGHNESISTSLSTLFTSAGYTANTLNLTEEKKIPDDASVLVLSLPQTDYTEDEINLIDAFVKNGGDLMVFDGTSSPTDLPVLYSYLKEWGITVNSDMVLDSKYNIDEATDVLAQLTDSDANSDISDSDQTLVAPNAKSLTAQLPDSTTDRTVETLMESRDSSYSKVLSSDTSYDSYDKADGDTDGPFALAALAQYTGNDKNGQVFVCSAGIMMSDDLMNASSLMNHSFLNNVLSQMQPEVTSVSIPSKSLSSEPLVISTTAEFFVFLIPFLIPVAMFVGGIVVFVRRRKL